MRKNQRNKRENQKEKSKKKIQKTKMASKPPASYPNYTITRRKLKDDYLEQAGAEYGTWLEFMLGESLPAPGAADLLESLKGGDALCKIVNRIMQDYAPPGAHVVKWKPPTTPFIAVENIRGFLKACSKIGLNDNVSFLSLFFFFMVYWGNFLFS